MAKLNLGMSDDPSDQAALGLQMLQSGKVSPQEVKAAQIAMKDPGGTQDWLSKYLGKSSVNPYTLKSTGDATPPAAAAQLPPDDAPAIPSVASMKAAAPKGALPKGTQTKQEAKQTTDKKNSITQNSYLDDDKLTAIANSLRSLPEYQDQQKGIEDLNAGIEAMKNRPPVNNQDWFVKPFLGLTDAQTGSNFSKGFTPQETQADRNAKLLAAQEDLQKKKADMTKALLEGITKIKSGSETNSMGNSLMQSNAFNQGIMTGQSSLADNRRNAIIAKSGSDFDKDAILKTVHTTLNSLDRADSMMKGKTPVTGKNFAILQQDMINAMAPGGAATEGKVNREMVETLASKLNDLQQKFGNIKDLRKEQPQVFAQLQGLLNQVRGDFYHAGQNRADELAANYKYIQDPDVQSTVNNKVQLLKKRFGGDLQPNTEDYSVPVKGKKPAQAAAGPAIDADLSKMSNDQLKEYLKTHGG